MPASKRDSAKEAPVAIPVVVPESGADVTPIGEGMGPVQADEVLPPTASPGKDEGVDVGASAVETVEEGLVGEGLEVGSEGAPAGSVRLQRFLAEAGVASRRAAEAVIVEGRVAVNDQVIREKGHRVNPAADRITLDGRPLQVRKKLYVALNKPRGYTCTRRDEHAERIVGDLLPAEWGNLYPVGRLDRESEGLLFLTNDGDFCLRLTHPRYGIHKTYLATVEGHADNAMLDRFRKGVFSEGDVLRIVDGRVLSASRGESLVELELAEGRYHEVRRLFGSERMEVLRLVRTRIGPIKLGELKPGRWRTLTPGEVKTLLAPQQ